MKRPAPHNYVTLGIGLSALACRLAIASSTGPIPAAPAPAIPAPEDKPFPGTIQLSIDATDIDRKVAR